MRANPVHGPREPPVPGGLHLRGICFTRPGPALCTELGCSQDFAVRIHADKPELVRPFRGQRRELVHGDCGRFAFACHLDVAARDLPVRAD